MAHQRYIDCDPLQQTTPTSAPGPSRHGTALLELKRRHVSQRLNELQIRLGQIKRCQQCDGESKDGTRGRSQRDGSCARQGAGQQLPDIDGCGPTDCHWQDGIPALQSLGQKTITSLSENHVSGPASCSGDTRSDRQAVVDGPGQQGEHSQITSQNMAGYSDLDETLGADQTIV